MDCVYFSENDFSIDLATSPDYFGGHLYEKSMKQIKEIISQRFLPFVRQMKYDTLAIVQEVAEKGFYISWMKLYMMPDF